MAFNKGYELKKFEAHWEKLRIEYAAAGMAEDPGMEYPRG